MKPRQATAYAHPCFEAEECVHSRFKSVLWTGARRGVSTILTANIGLE